MEAKQKLQALYRARVAQKQQAAPAPHHAAQPAALPAPPAPVPPPAPRPTAEPEEPPAKRLALPRGFFDDAKADAKAHGVPARPADPACALAVPL